MKKQKKKGYEEWSLVYYAFYGLLICYHLFCFVDEILILPLLEHIVRFV